MKREMESNLGFMSAIFSGIGLVLAVFTPLPGIVLSIIGIVLASKQDKIGKDKWSKMGRKYGIIGIVVGVIMIIVAVVAGFLFANLGLGQ